MRALSRLAVTLLAAQGAQHIVPAIAEQAVSAAGGVAEAMYASVTATVSVDRSKLAYRAGHELLRYRRGPVTPHLAHNFASALGSAGRGVALASVGSVPGQLGRDLGRTRHPPGRS